MNSLIGGVERGVAHPGEAAVRATSRTAHLKDLAFDPKSIAGSGGNGPAQFLDAGAENAAGGAEFALDKQPHGHAGDVHLARRREIDTEPMGDIPGQQKGGRAKSLTNCEIFEVMYRLVDHC